MARKQPKTIDLDALANAPGVVLLTVDGRPYKPRRRIGPVGTLTPDPRAVERVAALDAEERRGMYSICVKIDVKTKCKNAREHWAVRAKRIKAEYEACEAALKPHVGKRDELAKGCVVTMTRIGRAVDDDNLAGYVAHIRDFVAFWLLGGPMGKMDSDPRITWIPQQKALGNSYGVVLAIEPRGAA